MNSSSNISRTAGDEKITRDKFTGDKITVGNVSDSYAAIGAGASVLVTQINQALSAVDEMEKSIRVAEQQLADAIQRRIIQYASLAEAGGAGEVRNPYKSLLEYEVEDAPYFYGRDDAIAVMGEHMHRSRLTILESESGSGKTSLIKAGLISRLIAGGDFALYVRSFNLAPETAIKRSFLPDYDSREDLARFRDDSMGLPGFLERICYYLGDRQLVIFLDQFEEFFNKLPDETQQEFASQLRESIESALPVRWVLAMRKEYLSELRLFEGLKPFDNRYFLPAFKFDEAYEVFVRPAALKGVSYEDGLVRQIVSDINQQAEAISPVQVQLVCYTLFEEVAAEPNPNLIARVLYEKRRGRGAGEPGAEGILTSHLTRVLDSELRGEPRPQAVAVLEALVTYDGRRDIKTFNALAAETKTADVDQLEKLLRVLVDNRLLRSDVNENDDRTYELAHDYLLREVEVDPDAQSRKLAQQILNQEVNAWNANKNLLIPFDKLAMLEAQQQDLYCDDQAKKLLDLSRKARRNQRLKNLGALLSGSLAIVIIATLAINGWIQRLVYRPPEPEMIAIPGGSFVMGTSPEDLQVLDSFEDGREPVPSVVEFTPADPSMEEGDLIRIEKQDISRSSIKYNLNGEIHPHEVYLDAFEIQKYEVVNEEYRQCIRSTACSPPANANFEKPGYEDHPVTDVDYDQAANYCRWLGGSLPTEAQWERAARFGNQEPVQLYAWGDEFELDWANILDAAGGMTQPVGTYSPSGDTAAGLVDMTGNVSEWVSDWYDENFYRSSSCCTNPTGPDQKQALRITRGGSFSDNWVQARITYRDANLRDGYPSPEVGFRCVRPQK